MTTLRPEYASPATRVLAKRLELTAREVGHQAAELAAVLPSGQRLQAAILQDLCVDLLQDLGVDLDDVPEDVAP